MSICDSPSGNPQDMKPQNIGSTHPVKNAITPNSNAPMSPADIKPMISMFFND